MERGKLATGLSTAQEDETLPDIAQGAFLAKEGIRRLILDHEVVKRPGKSPENDVKQWTYGLHLGEEAYLSSDKTLRQLKEGDSIVIKPGEFALLMTDEWLDMPRSHVGFISLKLSYALKGLINISGFHVDPDFHGRLVFSVYNAGPNPVVMRRGDELFMLIFAHLDDDAGPRGEDSKFNQLDRLKSEWITAVKGPAVSLSRLNAKVERLRLTVNLLTGLIIAMIATLIVTILVGR